MATELIKLQDGTFIEVETDPEKAQKISSKHVKKVEETIDTIKPIIVKVCKPVISAWEELNQDMSIEQAEVELGLSFEGEGNIYVTKAKAGANLTVKLILKPKE